ncbi:MAG: carboxy terminal-processing peptidase [Desulfuromonadaceae bacterium]
MSVLVKRIVLCLFLVWLSVTPAHAFSEIRDFDSNRARLLSFILRGQINQNHYSQKPIDDDLSKAAFSLYLKQLDGQKRFLLKQDVEQLKAYETLIDDEINRGNLELAPLGAQLLSKRVPQVEAMVKELIDQGFDLDVDEALETDPEKLDYCSNTRELRERWRKILKFQLLIRYLNLQDEQEELKKAGDQTASQKPLKSAAELREEAREKIRKGNIQFFERILKETVQDHYDRYFNAITRAFDPHTGYLPPQSKEDFDISMSGSLEGIGATLQEEDGYIKVLRIIPGSASSRQGQLQAEDVILEVAQGDGEPIDVTDSRLRDAVSLIRGKKGTEVRLTVKKPDGSIVIIPIIRDVVEIEETFVKGTILDDTESGKNFGYIRIPSFYRDFKHTGSDGNGRNSTDDVHKELKRLSKKGISGLVIDLRNNGGGALTDAVSITGLFIKKGPVVQIKNRNGRVNILSDLDADVDYNGPLVVLINRFSASASEILAGALQDYRRAVIIGSEHSYGKGTVQTMADLDSSLPFSNLDRYRPLGAVKVTTQKFYRVSGASTQYRGVVPDIILPDRLRYLEAGEQYVDNSLPWDTIDSTRFSPLDKELPVLSQLARNSQNRIENNAEFKAIIDDAERATMRRDHTLQSLKIDVVRKEREEEKVLAKKLDSPHGQEGMDPEEIKEKQALSDKERLELWLKELNKDPYVVESLHVLEDMTELPALAKRPE